MPIEIFQKVMQETENMMHKDLEDPGTPGALNRAVMNMRHHNRKVVKPIQNRNY